MPFASVSELRRVLSVQGNIPLSGSPQSVAHTSPPRKAGRGEGLPTPLPTHLGDSVVDIVFQSRSEPSLSGSVGPCSAAFGHDRVTRAGSVVGGAIMFPLIAPPTFRAGLRAFPESLEPSHIDEAPESDVVYKTRTLSDRDARIDRNVDPGVTAR